MRFGRLFGFNAVLGLTMLALPAAQMRPLPLAELSRSANLVVHGVVQSKICQRDDAGRIFTKVELSVSEVWKGATTNATITIFHGGGTFGNEHTEVSGQVKYIVGDEVVAFLVFNPRGEPVTLGLAQGEFRVLRDAITGEKFARNVFHGGETTTTRTTTLAVSSASPTPAARLRLSELQQTVKDAQP